MTAITATTEKPTDNAARIRSRLLAAFLPVTAALYIGAEALAAASAHMTQTAAAQFLVTSFGSGPAQAAGYVYFASQYAAPVVMGFALWRSRAVPRWLAVLFTIGLELAEAMGAIGPRVVLFMLPFAVAMFLLGARIWQAAARPASREPQPAPVPVSSI